MVRCVGHRDGVPGCGVPAGARGLLSGLRELSLLDSLFDGLERSPASPYLGTKSAPTDLTDSAAIILPIPYEATVSWGTGTSAGPRAILEASRYLERYDEELDAEPCQAGICTLPAVELTREGPERAIEQLEALYVRLLDVAGDRFVVGLGGEHSISIAPALAWVARLGSEVSILQLDAHADLRDSHHGTRYNHACTMRRILERTDRLVQVGIRSMTSEGRKVGRERGVRTIFAEELVTDDWVERAVETLAPNVYITFDLDFFDPSVLPATGTPEPGGADWWQALRLLRAVFAGRRVVGADVVELAPRPGEAASEFAAAKLVYKLIGYAGRDAEVPPI